MDTFNKAQLVITTSACTVGLSVVSCTEFDHQILIKLQAHSQEQPNAVARQLNLCYILKKYV
jgi:hypothetical protein